MATQGSVVIVASLKGDDLKRGVAQARNDIESLGKATTSSGEAMALSLAKATTTAEHFGRASKAGSDLARAGAIAAAEAERQLQVAIERVIAGTASASERSKVLTVMRRDAAAAARAQAEAERLAALAAEKHAAAGRQVADALRSALGPTGDLIERFRGGGVLAAGALAAAGAIAATATAIRQLGIVLAESVKRASEAEIATRSYEATLRGLGRSLEEGDRIVRRFSGRLVDDEALQVAVRNLSIANVQWQMQEKLIQRVIDIAAIYGKNTDDALEEVTRAIETQQARALKQLGILIDTEEAQKRYKAAIRATTRELTEWEKQQAFAEEFLRKSAFAAGGAAKIHETLAQKVQASARAWDNLLEAIGRSQGPLGRLASWWEDVKIAVFDYIKAVETVPGAGRLENLIPGRLQERSSGRSAPVFGTAIMTPETAARVARGEIPPPPVSVDPAVAARQKEEARKKAEEAARAERASARSAEMKKDAQQVASDRARLQEELTRSELLASADGFERQRRQAKAHFNDQLALAHGQKDLIARAERLLWSEMRRINQEEADKLARDRKTESERREREWKEAGEKQAAALREGLKIEALGRGQRFTPEIEQAGIDKRIGEIAASKTPTPQLMAEFQALKKRSDEIFISQEEARIAAAEKIRDALAEIGQSRMEAEIGRARRERDETLRIATEGSELAINAERLFQAKRKAVMDQAIESVTAAGISAIASLGAKLAKGDDFGLSDVVGGAGGIAGAIASVVATPIVGTLVNGITQVVQAGIAGIERQQQDAARRANEAVLAERARIERAESKQLREVLRNEEDPVKRAKAELDAFNDRVRRDFASRIARIEANAQFELSRLQENLQNVTDSDNTIGRNARIRQLEELIRNEETVMKREIDALKAQEAETLDASEAMEKYRDAVAAAEKSARKLAEEQAKAAEEAKERRSLAVIGLGRNLERQRIEAEERQAVSEGRLTQEEASKRARERALRATLEANLEQIASSLVSDQMKQAELAENLKKQADEILAKGGGAFSIALPEGDLTTEARREGTEAFIDTLKAFRADLSAIKAETTGTSASEARIKPGETPQLPIYVYLTNPKDLWAAEPPSSRFRAARSATSRSQGFQAPGNVRIAG